MNKTTSMQQSNKYFVVCRMQQQPYCATQWPVAQICLGQVQQVRQRLHVRCQGQVCQVRRATSLFAKEGNNEPLAKDGNWAGYDDEPLAIRAFATYLVQGNNEPLATKGYKTASIMQSNDKPLATEDDRATTFNDCKGTKAPMTRSIALQSLIIAIKRQSACNEISLSATLLQQMHWSNTFMSSSWEAMSTWLHHATINVADCRSNNNENFHAEHEQLHWQQSPSLLGGAQVPQNKCLVGEGVELLMTINLIGDWTMGNSEAVHPVHLTHKQCRGFPAVCAAAYSAQAMTTIAISKADNVVICYNQTFLLLVSTKSVNHKPQINQIEV
jgi:hypothetical protein